ncbi:MAG: hypothetical protein ACK4FS_10245, partial [Flavobacterium sp.]
MKTTRCKTFKAQITFGLYRNYSNKLIPKNEFIEVLMSTQKIMLESQNVLLSAKIKDCEIVFIGQNEPSIEIEFIQ